MKRDEKAFGAFGRTVLRKVFGAVHVSDERRWNHELYELYDDMDMVKCIQIQRISWLSHVVGIEDGAKAKSYLNSRLICGQWKQVSLGH